MILKSRRVLAALTETSFYMKSSISGYVLTTFTNTKFQRFKLIEKRQACILVRVYDPEQESLFEPLVRHLANSEQDKGVVNENQNIDSILVSSIKVVQ